MAKSLKFYEKTNRMRKKLNKTQSVKNPQPVDGIFLEKQVSLSVKQYRRKLLGKQQDLKKIIAKKLAANSGLSKSIRKKF